MCEDLHLRSLVYGGDHDNNNWARGKLNSNDIPVHDGTTDQLPAQGAWLQSMESGCGDYYQQHVAQWLKFFFIGVVVFGTVHVRRVIVR